MSMESAARSRREQDAWRRHEQRAITVAEIRDRKLPEPIRRLLGLEREAAR